MEEYKRIVAEVLKDGKLKNNRTGVNTIAIAGTMFKHDMAHGFPLLTTKKVPFRTICVELEGFIKGITDKRWFQDRGCRIWNEWCNPTIVPYGHDDETKANMAKCRDLGPIYGYQWRYFGSTYRGFRSDILRPGGVDQLRAVVDMLKTNPLDRRMIVSAWNPLALDRMALPPCHWGFQVTVINNKLNLLWNQRSVDVALGLPFNIASYGMLLVLLAKESGFVPGMLIGFLGDTHIYENHLDGLINQVNRVPYELPGLHMRDFKSIFDFDHNSVEVVNYSHHKAIQFDIAV